MIYYDQNMSECS